MKSIIVAALAAHRLSIAVTVTAQEPLRVGFLTVRTGPLAAGGRQMEEGINLFLKERNNTLAGRKVQIFFADTAGQPAQAKTKAQELVERDKVHILVGPLATFEALALDDYVLQAKVPLLPPMSAAQNDLAQRKQERLRDPHLRHRGAGHVSAGRLRGDEARRKAPGDGRRRLHLRARGRGRASRKPSRTRAARWCRSYGRRSTRRTTARSSASSKPTSRASTPASPDPIRFAFCAPTASMA